MAHEKNNSNVDFPAVDQPEKSTKKANYDDQLSLVVIDDNHNYLGYLNLHSTFETMCSEMDKQTALEILADLVNNVEKVHYKVTTIGNISVYGTKLIGFFSPDIKEVPESWTVVVKAKPLTEHELKGLVL